MKRDRAAYAREWRSRNREKHRATQRAYVEKNATKFRRYQRSYYLMKRYNMTLSQHAEMMSRCSGACQICGVAGDLVVDHDHMTLMVRGLLCDDCNVALGLIKDDPFVAQRMAEYLHGEL